MEDPEKENLQYDNGQKAFQYQNKTCTLSLDSGFQIEKVNNTQGKATQYDVTNQNCPAREVVKRCQMGENIRISDKGQQLFHTK